MREIAFDTETTGFDPAKGDRLIELACVELVNLMPTGHEFQIYIDPEREVPEDAVKVHGLTTQFLRGKPTFADPQVVDAFLAFIGDAPLIAHNAQFDHKFICFELERVGRAPLPPERMIDTLQLARRKFPGAPAKLDALCKRFGIDNSDRTLHGALLDARLLAQVYLQLMGGRERKLDLDAAGADGFGQNEPGTTSGVRYAPLPPRPAPLAWGPSPQEIEAHRAFVASLGPGALWLKS